MCENHLTPNRNVYIIHHWFYLVEKIRGGGQGEEIKQERKKRAVILERGELLGLLTGRIHKVSLFAVICQCTSVMFRCHCWLLDNSTGTSETPRPGWTKRIVWKTRGQIPLEPILVKLSLAKIEVKEAGFGTWWLATKNLDPIRWFSVFHVTFYNLSIVLWSNIPFKNHRIYKKFRLKCDVYWNITVQSSCDWEH